MGHAYTKAKAAAAQIEDAERVIVDSSALHCPICLCVFASTPVVLPCGHSFCGTCIRRLIETSFEFHRGTYEPTFECALCREKCFCDAPLTKNFAVEALLQSVDEIAALDSLPEADVNLRLSVGLSLLLL
ncbi:unnamed protein product [Toxocara canis]|uniref:RING-type domain-containing protein n=1 Tax=Toxocara canis TaxID=6265 RepID=A0A183V8J5_TOXCA|nr:unnamed protein product [Toxocara canis]